MSTDRKAQLLLLVTLTILWVAVFVAANVEKVTP